jgi:TRAP-type mannitol/chloroaromatic compound transport system permease small subunit
MISPAKLSETLKRVNESTGQAVAWITLPMVVLTFAIVVLRYVFDIGWIWMQEIVVWMHAAVFMLAAGYTLKRDEHVRVDIFYRVMSSRRKAWVDILGTLFFLFPVCVFLGATSWDYAANSWLIHEGSQEAGGLPFPFVPVLKSVIPLTAALLALEGIAAALKAVLTLTTKPNSNADD